jgi:hypothetical protein
MAQIDVDVLIGDPDFADEVTQIKRTPTVNFRGENLITEEKICTYGGIQPASGKVLQRLPESLRLADVKSFWIRGTITATAPGKYTDILESKGKRYQVQTVMDWSNFGEGFAEGTCVAELPS